MSVVMKRLLSIYILLICLMGFSTVSGDGSEGLTTVMLCSDVMTGPLSSGLIWTSAYPAYNNYAQCRCVLQSNRALFLYLRAQIRMQESEYSSTCSSQLSIQFADTDYTVCPQEGYTDGNKMSIPLRINQRVVITLRNDRRYNVNVEIEFQTGTDRAMNITCYGASLAPVTALAMNEKQANGLRLTGGNIAAITIGVLVVLVILLTAAVVGYMRIRGYLDWQREKERYMANDDGHPRDPATISHQENLSKAFAYTSPMVERFPEALGSNKEKNDREYTPLSGDQADNLARNQRRSTSSAKSYDLKTTASLKDDGSNISGIVLEDTLSFHSRDDCAIGDSSRSARSHHELPPLPGGNNFEIISRAPSRDSSYSNTTNQRSVSVISEVLLGAANPAFFDSGAMQNALGGANTALYGTGAMTNVLGEANPALYGNGVMQNILGGANPALYGNSAMQNVLGGANPAICGNSSMQNIMGVDNPGFIGSDRMKTKHDLHKTSKNQPLNAQKLLSQTFGNLTPSPSSKSDVRDVGIYSLGSSDVTLNRNNGSRSRDKFFSETVTTGTPTRDSGLVMDTTAGSRLAENKTEKRSRPASKRKGLTGEIQSFDSQVSANEQDQTGYAASKLDQTCYSASQLDLASGSADKLDQISDADLKSFGVLSDIKPSNSCAISEATRPHRSSRNHTRHENNFSSPDHAARHNLNRNTTCNYDILSDDYSHQSSQPIRSQGGPKTLTWQKRRSASGLLPSLSEDVDDLSHVAENLVKLPPAREKMEALPSHLISTRLPMWGKEDDLSNVTENVGQLPKPAEDTKRCSIQMNSETKVDDKGRTYFDQASMWPWSNETGQLHSSRDSPPPTKYRNLSLTHCNFVNSNRNRSQNSNPSAKYSDISLQNHSETSNRNLSSPSILLTGNINISPELDPVTGNTNSPPQQNPAIRTINIPKQHNAEADNTNLSSQHNIGTKYKNTSSQHDQMIRSENLSSQYNNTRIKNGFLSQYNPLTKNINISSQHNSVNQISTSYCQIKELAAPLAQLDEDLRREFSKTSSKDGSSTRQSLESASSLYSLNEDSVI